MHGGRCAMGQAKTWQPLSWHIYTEEALWVPGSDPQMIKAKEALQKGHQKSKALLHLLYSRKNIEICFPTTMRVFH